MKRFIRIWTHIIVWASAVVVLAWLLGIEMDWRVSVLCGGSVIITLMLNEFEDFQQWP